MEESVVCSRKSSGAETSALFTGHYIFHTDLLLKINIHNSVNTSYVYDV